MAQLFALRRRADSSADWESVDPVLLERQLGFQITNGEGSRPLIKLGDGTTAWTNLPFITRKNNLAATTAPTTGNDGSEYYEIGSLWANVNDPDNPDLYILTDLSSGATWVQVNAGGGAGTLAATLVLGNTTGGEDIVVSNGDVLDFSAVSAAGLLARIAAGNNYIYTKGSGSVAFKNVLTLFEAQSTTDSVLSVDQVTGEVEVGSPSYEGKFHVFSGTQDKKYILDVGNLTDNRIEVKPDAHIDWITGGATGNVLAQQADGSFKLQTQSAGGGIPLSGTTVGNPVTGDVEFNNQFTGIVMISPNGTEFRLTVADDGTLTTTEL